MSASTTSRSLQDADQFLLRWSDTPNSPSREEFVQMVEAHVSEAVIRSSLQINATTKVYLIGKNYTGIGVVRSCKKEGGSFILTIWIDEEIAMDSPGSGREPGVFSVESFISEEQEAEILKDLENEISSSSRSLLAGSASSFRAISWMNDFFRFLHLLSTIRFTTYVISTGLFPIFFRARSELGENPNIKRSGATVNRCSLAGGCARQM